MGTNQAVIAFLVALVALNLWATRIILRDDLSSNAQRAAQIFVVWLLPLVGGLLTLFLKRAMPETSSGRYREIPDPGDDFGASGQSYRDLRHAIDAAHHDGGDGGGGH
jgi:hypothetical protein